jgi:hypothetical protein
MKPRFLLVSSLALALTACGSDDVRIIAEPEDGDGPGTSPAVMVSVASRSPEGTTFYVGAYPELPAALDLSQMVETASGQNATAANGFIYVWSAVSGVYTRYAVDDELRLREAGAVSFMNLGGTGNVMTSFISPTRAYSMTRDNLTIVVWDPEAMVVLGTIDTSAAIDPDYPNYDYGEPVVFGDYVAWPVLWDDYDNFDFKPSVDVILASASSEEPAFSVSDSRCGGGWGLFTDDEGDLYALGNAWFGFAHFFDREPSRQPNDCMLRMRAGSSEFDPDFYVDLNRAADTPAVYHAWQSNDRSVVAAVWDSAIDPASLASPDDYWETPMKRKLVRIDDDASQPLEGIPDSSVFSTTNYRLDGELYMLMSEGSAGNAADQRSTLYRISGDRAQPAITTSGDLWSIGRVR